MVQRNQNPGAAPGGGHGSNPQNTQGGNRGQQNNQRQTSSPKKEIQIDQSSHVQGDMCYFTIRVTLFLQGNPIVGQEVSVEEGVSLVWNDVTNNDGEVVFQVREDIQDEEQIKVLTVRLVGTPDRRPITLTVPAKKKVKPTTKKIAVTITSVVDNDANECYLTFESTVFVEDQPSPQQPIIFKRGVVDLGQNSTGDNGKVTFQDVVALTNVERIFTYRVCLANFPNEEEINVSIPAAEKKKKEDNDPETLELMSHSDGEGNFRVKVRVTKAKGIAPANMPFAIWYKGNDIPCVTNAQGEFVYDVPDIFYPGEEQQMTATISGLEDRANITLRRKMPFVKTFAERRCRRMFIWAIIFWVVAIAVGPGKPLLNPDMFRGKDGLSSAERLYNETSTKAYGTESFVIKPNNDIVDKISNFGQKAVWLVATGLLIFAFLLLGIVIVRVIVYRSEEAIEDLMHRSYSKADDPMFEKLAKYVGSYSLVKKSTAVQVNQTVSSSDSASPAAVNQPVAHPAFGKNPIFSFIGLDLMMEIVLGVLKKVFFN